MVELRHRQPEIKCCANCKNGIADYDDGTMNCQLNEYDFWDSDNDMRIGALCICEAFEFR